MRLGTMSLKTTKRRGIVSAHSGAAYGRLSKLCRRRTHLNDDDRVVVVMCSQALLAGGCQVQVAAARQAQRRRYARRSCARLPAPARAATSACLRAGQPPSQLPAGSLRGARSAGPQSAAPAAHAAQRDAEAVAERCRRALRVHCAAVSRGELLLTCSRSGARGGHRTLVRGHCCRQCSARDRDQSGSERIRADQSGSRAPSAVVRTRRQSCPCRSGPPRPSRAHSTSAAAALGAETSTGGQARQRGSSRRMTASSLPSAAESACVGVGVGVEASKHAVDQIRCREWRAASCRLGPVGPRLELAAGQKSLCVRTPTSQQRGALLPGRFQERPMPHAHARQQPLGGRATPPTLTPQLRQQLLPGPVRLPACLRS